MRGAHMASKSSRSVLFLGGYMNLGDLDLDILLIPYLFCEGLHFAVAIAETHDLVLEAAQQHHFVVPPLHQAQQTSHEQNHHSYHYSI